MGCRSSTVPIPSIVAISAPSAWTARTVHDFTDSPSRWIVHAPQLDVSQPTWVPVRFRLSRSACTSSSRGSTSRSWSTPLTFRRTFTVALIPFPLRSGSPGEAHHTPRERRDQQRKKGFARYLCGCGIASPSVQRLPRHRPSLLRFFSNGSAGRECLLRPQAVCYVGAS